MVVLSQLLPVEHPHPTGSKENEELRHRIVAHLRALGLSVRVQKSRVCRQRPGCRDVHNIVAQLPHPKAQSASVVLMSAHYDSVSAGPGIADDAAGVVAVVEAARLLRGQATVLPVALLLSDGEEAGLLGARGFVRDDPLARRIAAVVNLEARGTSGPSAMFQAVNVSAEQVALMAVALKRPVTSSLFSLVYEKLPNDTDLSVFGRAGMAGFNFAFFEEVENYHTPRDNRAHLSLASLQHHGDNVLQLTQALASQHPKRSRETAVWFDLLGRKTVTMATPVARWVAMGIGSAWFLLCWLVRRRGGLSLRRVAVDLLQLVGAVLATCALAWLYLRVTHRPGDVRQWITQPWPHVCLLFVLAFGLCMLVMRRNRSSLYQRYFSIWSLWAMAALLTGAWLPRACHLFWVPLAVALVSAVPLRRQVEGGEEDGWLVWGLGLAPALVAALFWARLLQALVEVVTLLAYPVLLLAACLLWFTLFAHGPRAVVAGSTAWARDTGD